MDDKAQPDGPHDSPSDAEVALRARRLAQGRNAPRAGRALGELGARALPALIEALAHDNPFVRSGALFGLETAASRGADVAPLVVSALEGDVDVRVQETACGVLARLGPAAIELGRAGLERARMSPDERVARAATEALAPRA